MRIENIEETDTENFLSFSLFKNDLTISQHFYEFNKLCIKMKYILKFHFFQFSRVVLCPLLSL